MKIFYKLCMSIIAGLLVCTSCNNDENNVFKVDTGLIQMIADGGSSAFMVASDGNWRVESDQPWCQLSPESGIKDEIVQVTIDKSLIGEVRTAKITITSGDRTKELLVQQSGVDPELEILPAGEITVVEIEGTSDLAITSNRSWTAESDADWCKLAIGAGETAASIVGEGDQTLKVNYTPNTSETKTRKANIKITAGTLQKEFTVVQEFSDFSFTRTPELSSCMPYGETTSVYVGMSAAWTATSDMPWCTLENATSRSKGYFTATCAKLPDGIDERTAIITVVSGGERKEVEILQSRKQMIDSRDGKRYKMVEMPDGNWWLAENLAYTKGLRYNAYSNQANDQEFKTSIAADGINSSGYQAIGSYWCNGRNESSPISTGPFNNREELLKTYGALYTWETVMMVDGLYYDDTRTASGPNAWNESKVSSYATGTPASQAVSKTSNARGANNRGIAPPGWHIPTENEWCVMLDKVDTYQPGLGSVVKFMTQTGAAYGTSVPANAHGGTNAGYKLRSTNTAPAGITNANTDSSPVWDSNSTVKGTDEYGFCVIPAGYRQETGETFKGRGNIGIFWTASARNNRTTAYAKQFTSTDNTYYAPYKVLRITPSRAQGCSVRCVKDKPAE